jgi:hypothetical protein
MTGLTGMSAGEFIAYVDKLMYKAKRRKTDIGKLYFIKTG